MPSLLLQLLPASLIGASSPCVERNLLMGSAVEARGWTGVERVHDGRVGAVGDDPRSGLTARATEEGASLTFQWASPEPVRALMLEFEGDDAYLVEILDGTGEWRSLGVVTGKPSQRLDIVEGRFAVEAQALRVQAVSGAPWFLAEVGAWRCGEPWPPTDLSLHEGRPELAPLDEARQLGPGRALVGLLGAGTLLLAGLGRTRPAALAAGLLAGAASGLAFGLLPGLLAGLLGGLLPALGRRAVLLLPALLLASALAWTNFGIFRHPGTVVHYHELFHYSFGARYAPELGYERLYDCAVVAEAELSPERRPAIAVRPMRDLATGAQVTGASALARAEDCHRRFGPDWERYRDEVGTFRYIMADSSWQDLLNDHGYNPSPAWSLMGAVLGSGPPLSTVDDLNRLAVFDPILLALAFGLLAWGFGWEAAGWAALVFALGWPWRYGYIGGSYLRFVSFLALVAGLVGLRRGRHGLAGVGLGLAGLLRVFPGLVPLPVGLGLLAARRLRAEHGRLALGLLLAVLLGVGLSAAVLGVESWLSFLHRLGVHQLNESVNRLGPEGLGLGEPWTQGLKLLLLAGGLGWIVRAARRGAEDWRLLLQGLVLVLGLTNLSCYYWVLLSLLGPALAGRPARGALLLLALVGQEALAWSDWLDLERTHGLAWLLILPAAVLAADPPRERAR